MPFAPSARRRAGRRCSASCRRRSTMSPADEQLGRASLIVSRVGVAGGTMTQTTRGASSAADELREDVDVA